MQQFSKFLLLAGVNGNKIFQRKDKLTSKKLRDKNFSHVSVTEFSVQSRIAKEGVIFYPLFSDLGVIW